MCDGIKYTFWYLPESIINKFETFSNKHIAEGSKPFDIIYFV